MLIQAGQAFASLEILLDGPPEPGGFHQHGEGNGLRGVAAVEGQFPGARVAADQQPAASRALFAEGSPGPVVVTLAFGPGPGGQPLPGPPGETGGELISAQDAPGSGGHPVIAGHGQHVADLGGFQPGPQLPVVPVGLVGGEPAERHPGGDGPLDHPPGQLRLGGELHVIGDPRGAAAAWVTGPGPGQIQLAVDQRMTGRRGVAQIDRYLGILDPPSRAGVLPLDPGRGGAFLEVTGLIDLCRARHKSTYADPATMPRAARREASAPWPGLGSGVCQVGGSA